MRKANSTATLGELLGKNKGSNLSLDDLPDLLGEKMPDLPMNKVGRMRLIKALQQRMGVNYLNIKGVKGIIEDFDKNMKMENIIAHNKAGV